ncbi:heme lyase CcmF/NrfE family subunit [Sulfurirhabdus autotrophica]|uniref:Cytochrome c-type biogenesis protein CcmF n=1 Tax=Sulfurirhabdus autotrophica TaxID=1706046 RepID=A0A4R3YF29_9PROT|nr:heme lyase CcmF/NrfE family subunit [Sulfurirhabdus autotrophica]TCV89504.1 cytochrome c-type biogenesis protein CcmF [Sulfurirhabdus autotrophica]
MIPELGQFALILAALLALIQGIFPLIGAARSDATLIALARPVARGQFFMVLFAFGCLVYAFLTNDFSVLYVASNSNSDLPAVYRFGAVWGGHEGSLLLWVLILGGWTFAVSIFSKHLPDDTVARVIGVMGLVSVGFLAFLLFTSNPFDRLFPMPFNGRDLNPLLQDPGLVFHPPMLYMGYVGFSVAFAFAIAALMSGRLDAAWARWSRPWTTMAWMCLTVGIAMGSMWAYYELGWGGWWFWDPVENASFIPWLVGTALIHSLAVTEKRGGFKSWTILLAISAFSLSLLGTFLVRSGVLTSVHAFATDPKRGIFILMFLAFVVGSSLILFAWRAPKIGLGGAFELASRESMLLGNNVLLSVAAATVLLGTLYPLVLDALGLGKISVGPPYFEAVFVPLLVPALLLMGVGPLMRWKKGNMQEMLARLRWPLIASVVLGVLVPFALGKWTPMIALGIALALWVAFSVAAGFADAVKHSAATGGVLSRLSKQSRSWWGMQLAHFGIAIFVAGVTMVKGFEVEKDVKMEVNDVVHVSNYQFQFKGVTEIPGPNYKAMHGTVLVSRNGQPVTELHPEKRTYFSSTMPQTEAAIRPTLLGDLYVSLGEPVENGAWSVRVYYKPLVDWIWGGCIIMAMGGFLAVSDKRYRMKKRIAKQAEHSPLQVQGAKA